MNRRTSSRVVLHVSGLLLLSLVASAASGIDCVLNEKTMRWAWHSVEASADENGAVTVPFGPCPGPLTVRLVQNGEVIFRAEAEQEFLSGELLLQASAAPSFSRGLIQTYPSRPMLLRPGRYSLHFAAAGEIEVATLVDIPDPNKLSKLDVGEVDVRVYIGPRLVSELTLRSSDGTVVWNQRFATQMRCVKLALVSGVNDQFMTSGCDEEATEVNLGRFDLEKSRWYELEAEGPNGTYAAYFPVP